MLDPEGAPLADFLTQSTFPPEHLFVVLGMLIFDTLWARVASYLFPGIPMEALDAEPCSAWASALFTLEGADSYAVYDAVQPGLISVDTDSTAGLRNASAVRIEYRAQAPDLMRVFIVKLAEKLTTYPIASVQFVAHGMDGSTVYVSVSTDREQLSHCPDGFRGVLFQL